MCVFLYLIVVLLLNAPSSNERLSQTSINIKCVLHSRYLRLMRPHAYGHNEQRRREEYD